MGTDKVGEAREEHDRIEPLGETGEGVRHNADDRCGGVSSTVEREGEGGGTVAWSLVV